MITFVFVKYEGPKFYLYNEEERDFWWFQNKEERDFWWFQNSWAHYQFKKLPFLAKINIEML